MYNILLTALVVVSIILILLVVMQPSKSNAASMLTGTDSENPAVKQKARGFEAFLIKATTVIGALFFGLAIVLAILTARS